MPASSTPVYGCECLSEILSHIPGVDLDGPPSPLAAGPMPSFSHARPPRPVTARILRERVAEKVRLVEDTSHNSKSPCTIAQLQEFVQGSKQSPMPSNCSILQWSYDERMAEQVGGQQFRAIVAFVLDGIPHHVAGAWQSSKKLAQRDAAEDALVHFVTRWGQWSKGESPDPPAEKAASMSDTIRKSEFEENQDHSASEAAAASNEAKTLACLCSFQQPLGMPPLVTATPRWSHTAEYGAFKAFVEIELLGVAHMFTGCTKPTLVEACQDTAERVLWYLQCPGYEDKWEADLGPGDAKEICQPPAAWIKETHVPEDRDKERLFENKRALMRVQNRLQKTYRQQIQNCAKAIQWSEECSHSNGSRISQVRATAYIPAADRYFTGGWKQSKREAKIDACRYVSKFLDDMECQASRDHGT